ncbi:Uma2 family endonuclease [Sorangium sp. So ce726]|uniref:Uma2 family endonuclease n=1 Tax=Sorangium sp. So ce726 TaxID=3133319 RepID=UPI003F6152C7
MAQKAPHAKLSPEEYLALERSSEVKHEYAGGEVFAMSGGTREHSLIAANVVGELRSSLRARPCEAHASDLRIKNVTTGRYVYPDASVVCGQPLFEDEHRDTLLNPTAVFEVLSDSSESYDRGGKFALYRGIPSIADYVLLSQKQVEVEHFRRQPDGTWLLRVLGPGERLQIASIGCDLAVDELYLKVFARPTGG